MAEVDESEYDACVRFAESLAAYGRPLVTCEWCQALPEVFIDDP